jgi:hypothetical protein
MARLVVSAVAAVAVGYFLGPTAGLQTFAVVYGATGFLDPNKKIVGPKLTDLKAPAASLGAPILYLEGAMRVAGVYAWTSEKRAVENTSSEGGKGGPGVDNTFFTYEMDLLIAISTNRCQALLRVWSNGRLVWSNRTDADAETVAASATTNAWRDIRFYDGNEDQMPDPVYEAAVGVGNAPAYLDRTMIFIEGANLGQSGQLPVFTFEVASEASQDLVVTQDAEIADGDGIINGTPAFTAEGYTVPVGQWDTAYYLTDEVLWWRVDPGVAPLVIATTHVGQTYLGTTHNSIRGQSDEPCYVYALLDTPDISDEEALRYSTQDGVFRDFERTGNATEANSTPIFAKRGSLFVYALHIPYDVVETQDKTLRIFDFNSTLHLRDTEDVGVAMWDIAISLDSTKLYAISKGISPAEVFEFDVATGVRLRTIVIPAFTVDKGRILVDAVDGTVYAIGNSSTNTGGEIRKLVGSTFELYSAGAGGATGIGKIAINSFYSSHGVVDGVFYTLAGSGADPHDVWRGSFGAEADDVMLDQVVRRLCLRTGLLTDDDIDVTDLEGIVVHGFAVTQVSTTRAALEILMGWYLFEAVEGPVIRFVLRGGSSVATIPYEDLAASPSGSDEPLPMLRRNDIESPARFSVKFANILNDYQDGLERADRLVTESTAEAVIEFAIGGTPSEAAKVADSNTLDAAVGLLQIGPIALTRKYARLEPTDVITVTDDQGDTFRTRIVKGTIGAGLNRFELVLDDATVVNSAAETDEDYSSSTLIRLTATTEYEMLDIPILRDADNAPGPYAAFSATSEVWPGAEFDKSADDITYAKLFDVGDRATRGEATTVLADFTGGVVFDEVSSVEVDVGDGILSSSTRDTLLAGTTNALLIGSEIVQFRDAAYVSEGVYTLTGFIRGLRGTEWAMGEHAVGDRVVLLKLSSGIRKVPENAAEIGTPAYYKAVTHGKSRASVDGAPFTDTGVALKPFAVVNLRALPSGPQDVALSWDRRSRLSSRFLGSGGSVVPLGEAVESYEVDVLDGATVLRTASVSSPEWTYTQAMQASDGVDSATALTFSVYQMSAIVGRGYVATVGADGRRAPLPQIETITIGGTYASGATLFVAIGSTRFDYTSTVPDATLSGIATSLATLIDADADYVAAAVGPVITVTGPDSVSEPVTAGQSAGDNTITLATTQTAAPVTAGHREEFNFGWNFTGGVASGIGHVYTVRAIRESDGMTLTYSVANDASGSTNPSVFMPDIHSGFLGLLVSRGDRAAYDVDIAADPAGVSSTFFSPLTDPNWTVETSSTDPNAIGSVGRRGVGVAAVPVARAQISTATLAGTPATGRIYRLTLGGVNYDYTAGGGDTTMTLVAAGLAPVVDAAGAYIASNTGAVITITGAVANVPFTTAATVVSSTVTATAVVTQSAA